MASSAMAAGMLLSDRYRLDDLLSETGDARFWRGTDTVLGRAVAINVLPSDDPLAPRLITAARNSATVQDPRLLRVLDADDSGEVTWVVNEWGAGLSLDILLQRGPLDPTRAAWLTLETATTIQAAHAAGICHGRLSPESVLVTEAGAVKIIGFAISAAIEGGGADQQSDYGHLEPTEADIIDLAGILYAGLTGRWPGVSPSDVPPAPTDPKGPLRPRQVRHGVPRMLDALCTRVLRKAAHEHAVPIGSAVELVAALNDFLGSPLTGAPVDISHMHEEPEVHQAPAWDPDATQLTPVLGMGLGGEDTQSVPREEFAEPVPVDEPDLPPFEDSAERPLFAPNPRRPRLAAEPDRDGDGEQHHAEPDRAAHAARASRRGSRGRLALIGLLALAVIAAMVLAFRAGMQDSAAPDPRRGTGDGTTDGATAAELARAAKVRLVGAQDFDPQGQPAEENTDRAALAVDGDPATGWPTKTYFSAGLGGLKDGVGLVVDLGTQVPVRSVELALSGRGTTTVEVRTTPTGVNSPPVELRDLQRPAATGRLGDGGGAIALERPRTTRYLAVWLTSLPQVGPGKYRAEVREITVRR